MATKQLVLHDNTRKKTAESRASRHHSRHRTPHDHLPEEFGPRFLPGPTTAFTYRRLYFRRCAARPRGFLAFSCASTFGVCPRTYMTTSATKGKNGRQGIRQNSPREIRVAEGATIKLKSQRNPPFRHEPAIHEPFPWCESRKKRQ